MPAALRASPSADAARAAISEKRFERAVALVRVPSEMGDPDSQLVLAGCYERGWGVPQDIERAAGLYERCARQGLLACQAMIAGLYRAGYGVPKDPARARRWYGACAARGDAGCAKQLRDLGAVPRVAAGPIETPALVVKTGAAPPAAAPVAAPAAPTAPAETPAPAPRPAASPASRAGALERLSPLEHLLLGALIGLCAAGAFFLLR